MLQRSENWLWLLAFAAIVGYQTFLPPIVGMADNNDFAKISGRVPLCSEDRTIDVRGAFIAKRWIVDEACRWESGIPSLELWLAKASVLGHKYDIRQIGFVHSTIFLLCAAGFLWLHPPRAIKLTALFLFTDVTYVAMFNSFYTDTAALLFLLASLVTFIWAERTRRPLWIALYILSGLCLVAAKSQHCWLAIPLIAALFRVTRWAIAVPASLALAGAAVFMFISTPPDYAAQALWNVIFPSILKTTPTPKADLHELGLDDSFIQFIGKDTYRFDTLDDARYWRGKMLRQTNFGSVLGYFARRPVTLIQRIARTAWESSETRPSFLGNFERGEGFAPGQQSRAFCYWSDFKLWLGGFHPAWAAIVLIGFAAHSIYKRGPAAILLLLGLGVITLACLTEGIDNSRHCWLGQAFVDLFVIGYFASVYRRDSISQS